MKAEHKDTKKDTHPKHEDKPVNSKNTPNMSKETEKQEPPVAPNPPNPPIPNTQPNVVNANQLTQIKQKYPQLTNDDLMGTREQIAARVSAKLSQPYEDIMGLIPEQA